MTARGFLNDFAGRAFGRWKVEGFAGRGPGRRSMWRCVCRCGQVSVVSDANLRSGKSRSCGCLKSDLKTQAAVRSGRKISRGVRSPEYQSWTSMIARATSKRTDRRGLDYSLRGIGVCRRWRKFDNFLTDMGRRPPGTSLERKNNDVGYQKRNCKWATPSEQVRNRRSKEQVTNDRTAALKKSKKKNEMPERKVRK